jgi:glycerophosphoryl diester phosphodiesterase
MIKIKKTLCILALIMVSVVVANNYTSKSVTVKGKNIQVIGHRGDCRYAPENTVSSILYAAQDKADYAELDVQETKDGVVVLMHDKNLKRVAGVNRNVSDISYRDIEKLDVGRRFSKKFKGEKIPTLDQVMRASKGKIKLDIEIKKYVDDTNLVKKVVKTIKDNNFTNKCLVCSFDYNALVKVKKLNPKIHTGYITNLGKGVKLNLKYADYYSVYFPRVNKNVVEKLHKNNKKVHVWTVDNKQDFEKSVQMGIDDIITNNPTKLKSF